MEKKNQQIADLELIVSQVDEIFEAHSCETKCWFVTQEAHAKLMEVRSAYEFQKVFFFFLRYQVVSNIIEGMRSLTRLTTIFFFLF